MIVLCFHKLFVKHSIIADLKSPAAKVVLIFHFLSEALLRNKTNNHENT